MKSTDTPTPAKNDQEAGRGSPLPRLVGLAVDAIKKTDGTMPNDVPSEKYIEPMEWSIGKEISNGLEEIDAVKKAIEHVFTAHERYLVSMARESAAKGLKDALNNLPNVKGVATNPAPLKPA